MGRRIHSVSRGFTRVRSGGGRNYSGSRVFTQTLISVVGFIQVLLDSPVRS